MSPKKEGNREGPSILSQAAARFFDWYAAARLFYLEMRQNFMRQADGFLRRVEYSFIVYLWISIGLLLMILGFFYLLIDYAQVSRGVVFSIGGLVIFLMAMILLQAAKIKKFKG